jgi:hypothetical protein
VVVTGAGAVLEAPADPAPFLRVRKNRKFMGVQDDLAVVAAGRALEQAGLLGVPLGERAGLYLAVGAIPFEREHVELLLRSSLVEGRFSMARFSTEAFAALNPLLTFRCLSNMPAFHVSLSFDLRGPYFVSYPGPGQLYLALDEAVAALLAGSVDVALLAGVAHQRNFLVEHHHARLEPPVPPERLRDAGACLVLERASHAGARPRARLLAHGVAYRPHHPFEAAPPVPEEEPGLGAGELGPAALPALVAQRLAAGPLPAVLSHTVRARDGIRGSSTWGPP